MTGLSRRQATFGLLACGGTALAGSFAVPACASGSALPLLDVSDPGPRLPRERYYVDIRRLIGGDGDIAPALRRAREAGLGAWIAPGRYVHSGEVDFTGMRIEAAADASISARGANAVMFRVEGGLVRLPNPADPLSRGSSAIRLKASPRVAAGDWLILFDPADGSWHAARPYYRAGEWSEVAAVSGSLVELASPLADDYAAGSLEVYRPALTSGEIVGGDWDCGDRTFASLTLCQGGGIEIDRLRARTDTAIMIDRCVSTRIAVGDGANAGAGRDDYLICIANSQGVRVSGNRLYARRHPVAIGGSDVVCGVPNRDCLVEGATLSNDPSAGVACGDLHGNTEYCGFVSCRIEGGIVLGGASPVFRRCNVSARADGNLAELSEFKGGKIDLSGTVFFSNAVKVGGGRGLIDLGTQNNAFNASTTRDVVVDLRGFRLAAPRLAASEAVIRVSNQGSRARLDILLEDGEFDLARPIQLVRTGGTVTGRLGEIVYRRVNGLPARSVMHFSETGERMVLRTSS